MVHTIIDDVKAAGNEFVHTLASFSHEQVNISPFEGSWTGAQVADHLMKGTDGVLHILYGRTEKAERPADQKVSEIKKVFLDFSLKFKSGPEILPSDLQQEKKVLLNKLKIKWAALDEAAQNTDLSELCADVEVRVFGVLTRLEWLSLVCYHMQRHTHQLKDILQKTSTERRFFLEKIF